MAFCGILLFFWAIGPIFGVWLIVYEADDRAPDDEKEYKEWIDKKVDEDAWFVILAPFKKKCRLYKVAILLEAALFACCTVLNRSAMTKLVSSTSVSALFAAFSIYARPYIEPIENWTDIAGRVFILITLGVGIELEKEPGDAGRQTCNVILGVVVILANFMFLVALNPIKLAMGITTAIRNARAAVNAAGWDEETIKNFTPADLELIVAADAQAMTHVQIFWLLRHHGVTLDLRIFDGITELDLKEEGLEGACFK